MHHHQRGTSATVDSIWLTLISRCLFSTPHSVDVIFETSKHTLANNRINEWCSLSRWRHSTFNYWQENRMWQRRMRLVNAECAHMFDEIDGTIKYEFRWYCEQWQCRHQLGARHDAKDCGWGSCGWRKTGVFITAASHMKIIRVNLIQSEIVTSTGDDVNDAQNREKQYDLLSGSPARIHCANELCKVKTLLRIGFI